MAVYSMTGYASATAGAASHEESPSAADNLASRPAAGAASVNVELRSVNGRFLDLGFRLPDEFRALEPALRELLQTAFRRGKIELRLNSRVESETHWPQPQPDQLNRLARLESMVQGWMPNAASLSVHEVLQWCKGSATAERLDDTALDAARRCIEGLREARAREGERLVAVLMERVQRLRELAAQAEPLVPAVVQRQQQRFLERWQEALDATGAAQTVSREALQERALNEAAAFSIRIDVAEELARLRSHLDEIERLLAKGGEVGKRLDFLIQELLREANTLGSKASALELTNISVEMKVAIEQLREQVQNLE
jgi:uncharacterized protein (TIGR00255 family)